MGERAEKEGKGIIWAGDFNVNPFSTDWSEGAFDQIRHKIKNKGTPQGAGSRTKKFTGPWWLKLGG